MSPATTEAAHKSGNVAGDPAGGDDEDDYLTMSFPEPQSPTKAETSHQRRLRQQREAEARGRPKSKAELAAEAERARESALATSIADQSKGAQMMAKLGYRPGSTLGAPGNVHARSEPIGIETKEGREGIGALREKTDISPNEMHADISSLGLTKRYPLYFSSFYKPQSSWLPDREGCLQNT